MEPGEYRSVNWLRREGITGPAYILHEEEEREGEEETIEIVGKIIYKNQRTRLLKTWAGFKHVPKKQPFDDIFNYFGPEVSHLFYMYVGISSNKGGPGGLVYFRP